jgi:Fur family transcriptional regulator, ferric uptake regulator
MTYYYPPEYQNSEDDHFAYWIRGKGMRVTHVRLRLMKALSESTKPISLRELTNKVKDHDESTIQRNLDMLIEKHLVIRFTFDPEKNLYETTIDRDHHHHIICTACGLLEDITFNKRRCQVIPKFKIPKNFASITNHSLEFFGRCKACLNAR